MAPNEIKQPPIIWWMIWGALLSGVFVMYFSFANKTSTSSPSEAGSAIWVAGLIPCAVSAVVRWLVLPRAKRAQTAFSIFVIGVALAEMTCVLGFFIFDTHKNELFILGVL